jgi:hypothetical protein
VTTSQPHHTSDHARPGPTARHPASPKAALEALGAAPNSRDFTTTLNSDDGQPPRLMVASRHAQLAEDIFADNHFYYWPGGQRIAAVGNPHAAASKVAAVLAATPEPAHG